jgi:hypothetical protein
MAVANQKRFERKEQELARDWFERPENLLKKYTREDAYQDYLNSTPEQQAATQQEIKDWWRRDRYPTLGERWDDFTADMSSAMSGSGVMESLTPEERARVQQAEEFNPYRAMGASMGRFVKVRFIEMITPVLLSLTGLIIRRIIHTCKMQTEVNLLTEWRQK